MYLSHHQTAEGPRWALEGRYVPSGFTLERLLEIPTAGVRGFLEDLGSEGSAEDPLLPPIEPEHEVWASGVTYLRSREARELESTDADAYEKVYDAEPELVLVLNSGMEIVGYTAGNDVSSRDIEGENTLYLPQAKVYDGACSLGPGIVISDPDSMLDLRITMSIRRGDAILFEDDINTSQMKRSPEELAAYLGKELAFPGGAFLMTGTGIVPEDDFTLVPGDLVGISVGDLVLENEVA